MCLCACVCVCVCVFVCVVRVSVLLPAYHQCRPIVGVLPLHRRRRLRQLQPVRRAWKKRPTVVLLVSENREDVHGIRLNCSTTVPGTTRERSTVQKSWGGSWAARSASGTSTSSSRRFFGGRVRHSFLVFRSRHPLSVSRS